MELKFKLILRTELFDSSTITDLVAFENRLIKIERYGSSEPLKNRVTNKNIGDVQTAFDAELDIMFTGKKGLWISISTTTAGIMMVGGGLRLTSNDIDCIQDVVDFVELFSKGGQLLYGYMCSADEFDDKHKVVRGSSVGWSGVSQWDFLEFLPGIHWYTIFGKELAVAVGVHKFRRLERVVFTEPGAGAIGFHLHAPITNDASRIADLEAIEAKLGKEFFFNKRAPESSYHHPDSFKEHLESFEKGY